MKTYGNPPVYEQRGHVEYPKAVESPGVLSRSIQAATKVIQERKIDLIRDRAQTWLDFNPDSIERWDTKYGTVAAWGGFRMYYGTCQTCRGLVTSRKEGVSLQVTGDGRWPKNCERCREALREADNDNARRRMRRLRAQRSARGVSPGSDSAYYRERRKAREQGLDPDDV
ncbi:hypothetical protein LK468_11460 [Mycobacteroides abscessus]|uniref:hypothetical protein n=1 Tax=Mycobacteroides abscessus TaxID=36809 RepID=UPI000C268C9C|nr:hypothetical protein [Mycobacteroides abscessus]UEA48858.1 hypothetical protein LK451_01140 [Mycobacteroides abscessus subsp. abscessus]UEA55336.1 hypothetical protein LK468_11460 [Mycobacteroides abscessus]